MSNQYTALSWPDRFWQKVNTNGPTLRAELGPCWLWLGTTGRGGYGAVRDPQTQKMIPAHRAAFVIKNGLLDADLDVCHKCDNSPCVRPSHLFSGTAFANFQDAVRKGRAGFHKFTVAQIQEIRSRLVGGETQQSLASEFGVDHSSISNIHTNRTWKQEVLCSKSI